MKLYELFADRSRWCPDAFAEDRHGRPCHSMHKEAVRWCLVGGIKRFYPPNEQNEIRDKILAKAGECAIAFNSIGGYDAVLKLCKDLNI